MGGLAFQDLDGLGGDPVFGIRVVGFEERSGGFPQVFRAFPQVFERVDEVADDMHGDVSAGGFSFDGFALGRVAVYQHEPGAAVVRVAESRLIQPGSDDRGDVVYDPAASHFPRAFVPGARIDTAKPALRSIERTSLQGRATPNRDWARTRVQAS